MALLTSLGFCPSSLNICLRPEYLERVDVACDQLDHVAEDDLGLEVWLEEQVVDVVVQADGEHAELGFPPVLFAALGVAIRRGLLSEEESLLHEQELFHELGSTREGTKSLVEAMEASISFLTFLLRLRL